MMIKGAARARRRSEPGVAVGPNPERNLPRGLFHSLEEFVLTDDWEEADIRVDGLEFLLSEWLELGSDKRISHWVEKHRGKDFIVQSTDDGTMVQARILDAERSPSVIPTRLVDHLIRSVLAQPEKTRWLRHISTMALVGEWEQLVLDEEKLLGHLLLVHQLEPPSLKGDSDGNFALHSEIHKRARQRPPNS
jgi:hypothetical protein